LRLLVTQLRHQDPLAPLDQNQFLAQSAQFSALEELQNIRAALELAQGGSQGASALTQAAVLIGKQITSGSALFTFDGITAPQLPLSLSGDVAGVNVEIMTQAGQVVQTLTLGPQTAGSRVVQWDGRSASGGLLSPGTYLYRVTAFDAAGAPSDRAAAVVGAVEGVSLQNGEPVVSVAGRKVRLQDVLSVLALITQ
ncbi:MAG: flagellar hook assembly protein FlgD, partial [Candidatus Rokubacteria bacterium]|nr:flagellar hook assembly protein FlgD [Candidatus Rokubacteria bacterium]